MKKIAWVTVVVAIMATTFFAGYWYSKGRGSAAEAGGERKILYYVDPMNPWQKYDKPGIAPCGMALEPVYEDGVNMSTGSLPPGMVMINPEKQQLIGVRTEQVEMSPASRTIRLLGKISADETRIYKVNSAVAGWVRSVGPFSTGSIVRKGDVLATFYTPEYLAAEQSYLSALTSYNLRATVRTSGTQAFVAEQSLQQIEDTLRFIGMGEKQIRTLDRTRELIENIDIEAPATGFILSRDVSPGLTFDKGKEFFSIADLSRVWVLLDTYGDDAAYFPPGEKVEIRRQGHAFEARVDDVLPQFDPVARTLRVRLVADNPDYALRPDMFVEVEYPVALPSAVTVPVDAVLDSGLRKTVFIDRGNGLFEPRRVETGKYIGDRVEIATGLIPGERIVISGNFLIDSESRFKSPATEHMHGDEQMKGHEVAGGTHVETASPADGSGAAEATEVDPICGMTVNKEQAKAYGLTSDHQGKTHFFCSRWCKDRFDSSPEKPTGETAMTGDGHHADSAHDHIDMPEHTHGGGQMQHPKQDVAGAMQGEMPMPGGPGAAEATNVDPICGMTVNEKQAAEFGLTSNHQGKTYFFCSRWCKDRCDSAPESHLRAGGSAMQAGGHLDSAHDQTHMPVQHGHGQMPQGQDAAGGTHGMAKPGSTAAGGQVESAPETPAEPAEPAGKMQATAPAEQHENAMNTPRGAGRSAGSPLAGKGE